MTPHHREGVVEFELGEELLLYVRQADTAVSCDAFARKVWRLCDGERGQLDISRQISRELRQPLTRVFTGVESVLRRLGDEGALEFRDDVGCSKERRESSSRLGTGRMVLGFEGDRVTVGAVEPELFGYVRRRLGALAVEEVPEGNSLVEIERSGNFLLVLRDGNATAVSSTELGAVRELEREVVQQFAKRRSDLLWLHAGAASMGSHAVMFAGAASRGKSTLVTGLCNRGWSYLSDEFVALDSRTLEASPFPRAPMIRERIENELTDEEALEMPRLEVPIEAWRIGSNRVRLGAVVFPWFDHREDSACLKPFPPSRAAVELLRGCSGLGRAGETTVESVAAVVGSVPLFGLRFGDGEQAVDLVDRASPLWWLD